MKQIDLLNTNNRINVDDGDYERLSRFKWTQTPEGYAATHIDGHPLYLHEMVNSFIAESDPEEEHNRESTFMAELLNMLDRVGIKPLMEKSCQRENSTDSSYNVMLEFDKDSIDKIKAYASAFGYRVTSVNQSKLDADYRRVNLCSKPGINSVILKKIQKGERWKLNRSDI